MFLFDSSAWTNEENYVLIDKDGETCSSAIGMSGGEQQLSLDGNLDGCTD